MGNIPRFHSRQKGAAMFLAVFLLALAGLGIALSNSAGTIISTNHNSQFAAAIEMIGESSEGGKGPGIEKECTLGTKQRVDAINEAEGTGVSVKETEEAAKSQCVVEWCDVNDVCYRMAQSEARDLKNFCGGEVSKEGKTSCYRENIKERFKTDENTANGFADHIDKVLTENPKAFTQSIDDAFGEHIKTLERQKVELSNLEERLSAFGYEDGCAAGSVCAEIAGKVDEAKKAVQTTQEQLDSLATQVKRNTTEPPADNDDADVMNEVTSTARDSTFSTTLPPISARSGQEEKLEEGIELGNKITKNVEEAKKDLKRLLTAREGAFGVGSWERLKRLLSGNTPRPSDEDVKAAEERLAAALRGEDISEQQSVPVQVQTALDRKAKLENDYLDDDLNPQNFTGNETPSAESIARQLESERRKLQSEIEVAKINKQLTQAEIERQRGCNEAWWCIWGGGDPKRIEEMKKGIVDTDKKIADKQEEIKEIEQKKKALSADADTKGSGAPATKPAVAPPVAAEGTPGVGASPTVPSPTPPPPGPTPPPGVPGPGSGDPGPSDGLFDGLDLKDLAKYGGLLSKLLGGLGGGGSGGGSGGASGQQTQNTQAQQQQDSFCAERYPGTKAVDGRCTCPSGQSFSDGSCQAVENTDAETGKTLMAELSCSPKAQDDGAPIVVSFACRGPEGTTARADGFTIEDGALSGSATVEADLNHIDPLTKIQKLALTCIKDGNTETKTCEIQVNKAALVVVANPSSINEGEQGKIGWLSAGAKRCEVRAVGDSGEAKVFNDAHQNVTQVNGTATTPPLTEDMEIIVRCETHGGAILEERTTINVR